MPTGHVSLMPTLRRFVLAGVVAERTDGQLLGAFVLDRDADAFGQLVRRHGPMVLGVCRRLLGDHANAEDAFQAVFLVLARRAADVKPREQVGSWLYGVAYRTALKARAVLARRRSREKQVDAMPELPAAGSADEWADLQPVIDEELAQLPEKLRLPVVLCDIEGRPQREVAASLGVPPATLATRLASARRTLALRLTKRGVTLSGGVVANLLTAHGATAAVPVALTSGLTRAAEAVASGAAYSGLVSAGAIQLSEGVMRMMMLTKLKATAVVALTAVALTTGLGLGLVPAYADGAGEQRTPRATAKAAPVPIPPANSFDGTDSRPEVKDETPDDVTFLRRLSLDLRGVLPTDIETFFFVADEDEQKRAKVFEWLVDEDAGRAFLGKQFGVAPERVRVVRMPAGKDGKEGTVLMLVEVPEGKDRVKALTLTVDGKTLTTEIDRVKDQVAGLKLDAEAIREQAARWAARLQPVAGQPIPEPPAGTRLRVLTDKDLPVRDLLREVQLAVEGKAAPAGARERTVRVWDAADGKGGVVWLDAGDAGAKVQDRHVEVLVARAASAESDLDFLKRVTAAARGTAPTALEERYFTEDKDPKKREKLIDSLLKEPAVAKKLGDDFKKRMLAAAPADVLKPNSFNYQVVPFNPSGEKGEKGAKGFNFFIPVGPKGEVPALPLFEGKRIEVPLPPATPRVAVPPPPAVTKPPVPPKPPKPPQPPVALFAPAAPGGDRLVKLVDELIAAKKTDADVFEALTLATAARLPTETEKRLTLGLVAKAADRKAAWLEVVKVLNATNPGAKQVEVELRIAPPAPKP